MHVFKPGPDRLWQFRLTFPDGRVVASIDHPRPGAGVYFTRRGAKRAANRKARELAHDRAVLRGESYDINVEGGPGETQ